MSTSIVPVSCAGGRAFKYQFDLEVQRVYLEVPFPCFVEVSWRRGNKSIQTKNRLELQANQRHFDVGQRMSMISTCYLDDTTRRFSQKMSMVNIIIYVNNVPKTGGCCSLDLSQVLNPLNHKECLSRTLELPLTKCPIKNSKISLVLHGTYLQEMVQDDRSIGSGISSALNYSDNFSMSFQRRTFEVVPRDSASMHNGGASNQQSHELNRQGSNKRIDENGSKEQIKRKLEPITPVSYFTSPLSSITENLGDSQQRVNQQRLQRIEQTYQLSSNHNNVQRESVSFRDEGFVNAQPASLTNSSKMPQQKDKDDKLREEKFKLQTENTQLKIFSEEQSKRMNDIVGECSTLKQELRMQQFNVENKTEQIKALEQELHRLRIQLSHGSEAKDKQIARLVAKTNELQSILNNHIKEIQIKLKEREEMRNQYQNYRQQAESLSRKLEDECRGYQNENGQLRREIEQWKATIEHSQRESEVLKGQLTRLQKTRSQQESSLVNDLRLQLKAEEQRTGDGEKRLRVKQKELQEKQGQMRSLTARLVEYEKQLGKLNESSFQSDKIIEQLKLSLSDSNRRAEEAGNHLQRTTKQLEGCRRTNSEMVMQIGLLEQELSEVKYQLETKHGQFSHQERELTAKLVDLQSRLVLQSRSSEETVNAMRREIDCRERSWKVMSDDYTRNIALLKDQLDKKDHEYKLGCEDLSKKLSVRDSELSSQIRLVNDLKMEVGQLSSELNHSKQELNRVLETNRRNVSVMKDYEQSRGQHERLRQQVANLHRHLDQRDKLLGAKQRELEEAKSKIRALCEQIQHMLIQNEELQGRIRHLEETELSQHLTTIGKLKQELERTHSHLNQLQASQLNSKDASASELNSLMKQNIQLQISLKVREEEAKKYAGLQRQVSALRNKAEFEGSNNRELEEQLNRLEAELKDKSRTAIIETEKAKMYLEERNNFAAMYTEKSVALEIEHDKCEVLDRNLRELEIRYEEEQLRSHQLESNFKSLTCETSRKLDRTEEVKSLQRRVKELQARDSEKISTIEQLTRNLCKSNDVIKDLHRAAEQKSKEFCSKQRCIQQLQQKLAAAQEQRRKSSSTTTDQQQAANEKRSLQRKNQLLLGQLCTLKQRLEEQLRHPSNSELTQRLASLQNQLYRKDEKLKKLERQNSKLEQQNIQLNIRIMKELTEIQKKQEGIKSEYGRSLGRVLSDSHNS